MKALLKWVDNWADWAITTALAALGLWTYAALMLNEPHWLSHVLRTLFA